ncbi:glycosyltransferase, partial [Thomasclavelia cocleata]
SLKMGGYEKVVVNYANELSKRGYNITIICGFARGELISSIRKDVSIVNFQSRMRFFLFPLIKYLKDNKKVDVIYSGFRYYNCTVVLAKIISRSHVKILATQHGFEYQNKFLKTITGYLVRKADKFIGVSKSVLEFEKRELKLKKGTCVYNPVLDNNIKFINVSHPWITEKKKIIFYCGRIAKDKNVDKVIQLFSLIKKDYLNEVKLMILGDGPEISNCKLLVENLKLSDDVDFLGYVDSPVSYFIHGDILIHLSNNEGFGNVIVEALYANLGIIVTECGGPTEIIDNKYGIVIGKSTDKDILEKGKKAICDILNAKLIFNGLKEYTELFTLKKATDRLLEVINE